jgi:hypothetical protein
MINLSIKTRLEFKKAFDRAFKYFIRENGLILIELVAHLHGKRGAVELRISGEKIKGKEEYNSMDMLMRYVEHMVLNYGLRVVYFLIHIHGPGEDPIGHLMITVQNEKPTDINLQGQELDYQINEFADSLPKA